MAITPIATSSTADVPKTSGVPSLRATILNSVSAIASAEIATLVEKYFINRAQRKWGIYDSSKTSAEAVLTSSHVKAVELDVGYNLTTAPLEDGAFAAYNKVRTPMRIALEVLCDGTKLTYGDVSAVTSLLSSLGVSGIKTAQTVRSTFVETLETLAANLNTYYVRTPEKNYKNMNIVGYSIRRTSNHGAHLIYADIILQEVRWARSDASSSVLSTYHSGLVQASSYGDSSETAIA